MPYSLLADLTLLFHLGFIVFVALGGLAVIRWPRLAWLHLPCVAWGVAVELMGWPCPLSPLENHFLGMAGKTGYETDFISRYLLRGIYPAGLDRGIQIGLGLGALCVNGVVYSTLIRKRLGRGPQPR